MGCEYAVYQSALVPNRFGASKCVENSMHKSNWSKCELIGKAASRVYACFNHNYVKAAVSALGLDALRGEFSDPTHKHAQMQRAKLDNLFFDSLLVNARTDVS